MQNIAKQFIYIFCLLLILSCEDKKAPTLNKIYIAYQGTEKVGVLNGETGEIIREVDVNISGMGDNPHYIVIDEVNNFWYVTLLESGYVLKYDLITDELISSIKIGNMPALMEIDTENNYLYVSRFNEDEYQPDNYKIDESVQDSYNFNDGTYEPLELVLSSDGQELFISCSDMMINEIRSFSTVSGALLKNFELSMMGMQPWHIGINPGQNVLYSASRMGNSVSIVNLNSDTGEITYVQDDAMNMPHGIGISSDGSKVFVTSSAMMSGGINYLHIIDTSTNTVINNVNLGTDIMATGLAVMQGTCSNCD